MILKGLVLGNLIEFTGGHQEQYGGYTLETLVPLLPLGSLSTDIDKLEGNILDHELVFRDTLCVWCECV